ncbi:unnamed protein product [Agarophyton chilense]|eukprot:gb/GEZJ01001048.1/.p2 GENE.gb/GEZJ01001048.1/~~gb/GEZJ01001048.1/.p2  ORF type:complete len:479 (+),score=58.92 gb/GEZJ01001048.1/:7384-8820(+)
MLLERLPYDVLLRVVHMLCARAPLTDMNAAALALAHVSPYLRRAVAAALSHSLTLRFESDAQRWAHVLAPSLQTLELLTFGSPRHLPHFSRLLQAPNLTRVRMPLSAPLLDAVCGAAVLRSLFVTSFSVTASAPFLRAVAVLPALRELRIDSRTAHLSDVHDELGLSAGRTLWQHRLLCDVASRAPRLHTLDIFVDDLTAEQLVDSLRAFPALTHVVLRTTCAMYSLPVQLEPVLLAMHTVALHGFRHVPCLDVSVGRAALSLSARLVAASHLRLCASVPYPALRQLDTVVLRDEPLVLPHSLTRLALLWHDPLVPKIKVQILPAPLCLRICSLPNLKHLFLYHVLISVENLQQLLRSLATNLHTLSVPVALQGCAPSQRLLQVFQLCARHCTELRELQVSEMRCRNFSSCGPAATASVQPRVWPGGGAGEPEGEQRLEEGLKQLCQRAPYLDERPMRSVIRAMMVDQQIFCRSVYAL